MVLSEFHFVHYWMWVLCEPHQFARNWIQIEWFFFLFPHVRQLVWVFGEFFWHVISFQSLFRSCWETCYKMDWGSTLSLFFPWARYFFVVSSFSFSGCITPIIIIILQVQSWFQDRLQECTHKVSCPPNVSKELCVLPETFPSNKLHESSQMPEGAIFFFSFSYRIWFATVECSKFLPIFVA